MSENNPQSESRDTRVGRHQDQPTGGKRGGGRGRRPHLWRRIILIIVAVFAGFIIIGGGVFALYASGAPSINRNKLASDNSTRVYDASGKVISRLGAQNRDYVKSTKIPDTLKNAVVSIEDRRFYKHHGVDPVRIAGAAMSNLTGSSLGLQGGSTLTQQLVKLSVFSTKASDQTFRRKAQEAWLALKIDRQYSKQQILEFYINKVYMGNGVYGMETAAKYYYGKSLEKLSLPQLALLAGMPQSPVTYDPYKDPKYAKERRDTVLQAMQENKVISATQESQAKATSIKKGLTTNHASTTNDPKTDKIIDAYLKQVYGEVTAHGFKTTTDGLKVYTNLNMDAQKHLYNLANGGTIAFPSNKFQVGATMVDPNNGKVVAMLGGRKTGKVTFGLNRAVQTDRSSGSTMKPLMDYGPAIQYLKFPTYQPVQDTPFTYPGTSIKLEDFDNKYQGTISMRKALVQSRNIPAIRTLQEVGMARATTFLKGLGMTFSKQLDLQNGIGAYISSEQQAAAYAAFANGGTYYKPYLVKRIVTQDGKAHDYSSDGKRAMDPSTAFMITDMLKGVMTSSNGSGTAANISGLHQAGKTGTIAYPSNFQGQVPADATTDSWFTGYTKNYSLSIWTGYDRPYQPNGYVTQAQTVLAQQMYREEMSYVSANKPNDDWTAPSDVVKQGNDYYVAGHPGSYQSSIADSTDQNSANNTTSSSRYSTNSQATSNSQQRESESRESSNAQSASSSSEQKPNGGNGNDTDNDNNDANKTSTKTTDDN